MKKLSGIILLIFLLALCLKCCIRADIPETQVNKTITSDIKNIVYPPGNKNVTINGIDYLQSQTPVGKYGGELVLSTIGEGPKTFNPCNTKDATSSTMAGMMYDGLLQSNRLIIDRPNLTERYMRRSIIGRVNRGEDIEEVWLREQDGKMSLLYKKTDG